MTIETKSNNELQIEVMNLFYLAFVKAVRQCNDEKHKVEIISEEKTKTHSRIVTVRAEEPFSFYQLGKLYATLRNEI